MINLSKRYLIILVIVALIVIMALIAMGLVGYAIGTVTPDFIARLKPTSDASLHDIWTRPADGMVMVYVPGGSFEMGSTDAEIDAAFEQCEQDPGSDVCERGWYEDESPPHLVTLDSFWIDKTEITNAQYSRCVEDLKCSPPSKSDSDTRDSYYGDSQYDNYPVIFVTWIDATAYCQWAGGRLPTEAEWEYAARGSDGKIYSWGNEPPDDKLLNYNNNVGDTAEVGTYPDGASWVGAMDMAGNVSEWVSDWYDSDYYASLTDLNPKGPETGYEKVLRGGYWGWGEAHVRAAYRLPFAAANRDDDVGFRCVVGPGN